MNRIYYLDFLKGFSIVFVVLLHTAAIGLSMTEIGHFSWNVCNVIDSLCRFVVPIFVMISGALLLNENKKFNLRKSLKRLFYPLVLWSMLYAIIVTVYQLRTFSLEALVAFLKLSFLTPTHNWFLFMLIGVYIMVPLLKAIIRNGGGKMLIALWLLFGVFAPFCKNFDTLSTLYSFIVRFSVTLPLGYIGYFVWGYELSKNNSVTNKIGLKSLIVLSIIMIICNAVLTNYFSVSHGTLTQIFYDYMSPIVVVYSTCIFLIVKNKLIDSKHFYNQWYGKYVVLMSKYSLAIYMFHVFILIFVQKLGINPTIFNPLISVPVIAIGIYVVTFLFVHIFAKLSFFRINMM